MLKWLSSINVSMSLNGLVNVQVRKWPVKTVVIIEMQVPPFNYPHQISQEKIKQSFGIHQRQLTLLVYLWNKAPICSDSLQIFSAAAFLSSQVLKESFLKQKFSKITVSITIFPISFKNSFNLLDSLFTVFAVNITDLKSKA